MRSRAGLAIFALATSVSLAAAAFNLGVPRWGPTATQAEFHHQIAFYLLLAGSLNFIAIALFLRFWPRPSPQCAQPPPSDSPPPETPASSGGSILPRIAVGAAIILAAIQAYPRLSMSLWGDEHWSLRESIAGRFQHDLDTGDLESAQDTLYWEGLGWEDALWRYETTNHHFLYVILAKGANQIWQGVTGAPDYAFSETALRLGPFLFGLAGLGLWARVLRPISLSAACLFPLLMAIHPWYLRYVTEGRGYALLFSLLPWLILALQSAVRHGTRRAWSGVVIAQTLVIYAWPGMVPVVAALQLAVGVGIYRRRHTGGGASTARRWILANLATAMLLLQILAPCIPQIWTYLHAEVPFRPLDLRWLTDVLSRMAIGCDGLDPTGYVDLNPLYVTTQGLLATSPILTSLVFVLLATGFVTGCGHWLRRAALGPETFGALLGTGALMYAVAAVTGAALYQWYFVYLLPFGFALVALGFAGLAGGIAGAMGRLSKPSRTRMAATTAALPLAALTIYAAAVHPQTRALRSLPLDPRRESVAMTRPAAAIDDPAHLRVITAHCGQPTLNYDPHGWLLLATNAPHDGENGPGLAQLMRLADATGAELWVNVGSEAEMRQKWPAVARMLDTDVLFEPPVPVHGLEPQFVRQLYRYRGGVFKPLEPAAPARDRHQGSSPHPPAPNSLLGYAGRSGFKSVPSEEPHRNPAP